MHGSILIVDLVENCQMLISIHYENHYDCNSHDSKANP